jgi:hypothetical protein
MLRRRRGIIARQAEKIVAAAAIEPSTPVYSELAGVTLHAAVLNAGTAIASGAQFQSPISGTQDSFHALCRKRWTDDSLFS